MAITKTQKIRNITVIGEYKILQMIGSEIIEEDGALLVEKEMAFVLSPTDTLAEQTEYQSLPASEKAKVDQLITALWSDEVKQNYQTFLASQMEESSE